MEWWRGILLQACYILFTSQLLEEWYIGTFLAGVYWILGLVFVAEYLTRVRKSASYYELTVLTLAWPTIIRRL